MLMGIAKTARNELFRQMRTKIKVSTRKFVSSPHFSAAKAAILFLNAIRWQK